MMLHLVRAIRRCDQPTRHSRHATPITLKATAGLRMTGAAQSEATLQVRSEAAASGSDDPRGHYPSRLPSRPSCPISDHSDYKGDPRFLSPVNNPDY